MMTNVYFGKSMYGGYYINFWDDTNKKHDGKHFLKLKDLKQWANENGINLKTACKQDN